jgi:hypothetical protein
MQALVWADRYDGVQALLDDEDVTRDQDERGYCSPTTLEWVTKGRHYGSSDGS